MSDPIATLIQKLGYTGAAAPTITSAAITIPTKIPAWIPTALGILAAVAIILVAIHYLYRPIFKFSPESAGIIPVPFMKSGATSHWLEDGDHASIRTTAATYNYSIALDVIIMNPLEGMGKYKPLFIHGPLNQAEGVTRTIQSQLGLHNLAITADKTKNDIIVSTNVDSPNGGTDFISALIPNVPIQQPFTVGVVMGAGYLEVYINGKLRQTKTFLSLPLNITGQMSPMPTSLGAFAKVRNLRIWTQPVQPAVMRGLPLPSRADFGTIAAPVSLSTTVCSA